MKICKLFQQSNAFLALSVAQYGLHWTKSRPAHRAGGFFVWRKIMKKPIPGFSDSGLKEAKIPCNGGSVPKTPSQPITSTQNGKGGFNGTGDVKPAKI